MINNETFNVKYTCDQVLHVFRRVATTKHIPCLVIIPAGSSRLECDMVLLCVWKVEIFRTFLPFVQNPSCKYLPKTLKLNAEFY